MLYYSFAELKVQINGMDNAKYFLNRLKDYEVAPFENADVYINHSEPDYIEKPEGNVLVKSGACSWITTEDGGYGIYDSLPNSDNQMSLVIADKSWSRVETKLRDTVDIGGSPNDLRSFNMVGDILRQAMLTHNGIMLHSSAIGYNGQGIAFSAPSGTGKSTHTSLWRQCYNDKVHIINDDTPAIRFIDGKTMIAGLPWSGTSGVNKNMVVPLKAIVCLERGEQNSILRLDTQNAIFRILNETTKPFYNEMTSVLLERVGMLIKTTPVYLLKCTISQDAVELVEKELFDNH